MLDGLKCNFHSLKYLRDVQMLLYRAYAKASDTPVNTHTHRVIQYSVQLLVNTWYKQGY